MLSIFTESSANKIDVLIFTLCKFTLLCTIYILYKFEFILYSRTQRPLAEIRVSNTTDFLTQIRTCRDFNRRREYKDGTLAALDSR